MDAERTAFAGEEAPAAAPAAELPRIDATTNLLWHLADFLTASYASPTCCGFQIRTEAVSMGEGPPEPGRLTITVLDELGGIRAPRMA